MREIWKPVVGYEGLYQVSNLGRVRSFHKPGPPKLIKICVANHGYNMVCLHKNGRQKSIYVGGSVLEAFKGCEPNLTVDHKDRSKINDALSNLRWATKSENQRNRSLVHNSASRGIYGVTPYAGPGGNWRGQAYVNGKRHSVGIFNTIQEASKAVPKFEKDNKR